jgi:2-polyprenyl-3-methyl-5-hydroxy-6-metoxy-1,4-benzoquinol methylase
VAETALLQSYHSLVNAPGHQHLLTGTPGVLVRELQPPRSGCTIRPTKSPKEAILPLEADPLNDKTRFAFGRNWQNFSRVIDDHRIASAETSLVEAIGANSLEGLRFIDIGCGSGLFSLAARRLGAEVFSFDYDGNAVACTRELQRRFLPEDDRWHVTQGSILDVGFVRSLGNFDIVYSWGVLHHTGDMKTALENAASLAKPGGTVFIAIYNEQMYWSAFYTKVKRLYNRLPRPLQALMLGGYAAIQVVKGAVKDLLFLANPLERYRQRKRMRGMSVWHDWVDWLGGYPFEVAKPEYIFDFFSERGFVLRTLRTAGGGPACNEFVFARPQPTGDGREELSGGSAS